MRTTNREKKRRQTTPKTKVRIVLVFFGICVGFLVVCGRVIYLNITKGTEYSNAVLSHQSYVNTQLPYERGQITDRNGVVLAENKKTYNVIMDPSVITYNDQFIKPTLNALVKAFGLNYSDLEQILIEKESSSYHVLLKNVEYEQVEKFKELQEADHKVVKGVWFETEYERVYPYGSLASHVIGYTNSGNVGTYGIEQYYNEYLNGVDGRESAYYDAELNLVKKVWEAEDGDKVVSTISVFVQSAIEKHIQEFMDSIGCENIGVLVMNPNNGEIYGMASNEGFDLNHPRDLSDLYSAEELAGMTGEEIVTALNKKWRNFCVNDTYEPGSTFKCLTVAGALEENLIHTTDNFYCSGAEQIGKWTIHCNKKTGHGNLSLTEALMKSCNMAMMEIVAKENGTLFRSYQEHFGLGSKTGIDLPGEAAGILISASNLNETELATSSFGQGFNVTMVQMAAAYSSLVNGGYYYQPHVVKEIVNAKGATVMTASNTLVRRTVTEATSEFIRKAGYMTVEAGTATPAKVEGYAIGGKTGTAQKGKREEKKYVVSFIGSAPADAPEVVIYVVIDEVHDDTLFNSSHPATELSSAIMKDILPYLGVYPKGEIDYGVEYEGEAGDPDEVSGGMDEGAEAEPDADKADAQ